MASTKFASEAYAEADLEKEARVVRTSALIALCSSVPVAALLMGFAEQLITLFSVPPQLAPDATFALRIASATFVINILNSILSAPQAARLRMDLSITVIATSRIIGLIGSLVAVWLGFGLGGAVSVILFSTVVALMGHVFFVLRLNRRLLGITIDRGKVGSLLRIGGTWAIGSVAAVLLLSAEKGVLAGVISTLELAYYSIAFTVASMLTMLASAAFQALFPAFSQLQKLEAKEHLNSIFARGIRLNVIWLIPLLLVLGVLSPYMFTIWAGADFGAHSTGPFVILLLGVSVNVLSYFPYSAIAARGRVGLLTGLYWIELIPHLAVVWILTAKFGAIGAASAWSIRAIVDAFVIHTMARKVADIDFSFRSELSGLLVPVLLMIAAISASVFIPSWRIYIVGVGILGLGAYAYYTWNYLIDVAERNWARSLALPWIRPSRLV